MFTSSSWVKRGPPGFCSIKMNPAIHRKSHAPCQYCSATPKLGVGVGRNHSEMGKRFHPNPKMLAQSRSAWGEPWPPDSWSRTSCVPCVADLLLSITFTPYVWRQEAQGPEGSSSTSPRGQPGAARSPAHLYRAFCGQLKSGRLLSLGLRRLGLKTTNLLSV